MQSTTSLNDIQAMWHPIASSSDLTLRHVYHGQVAGREFAVWRADDGYVNVWENRCLHRGVRLSIAMNDGAELKCQYHGWRYSNRTAACVYIPAHPADAPARTICNRTYPVHERYGLIWSGEAPEGDLPSIEALDAGTPFVLRPVPVNAPFGVVLEELKAYRFQPSSILSANGAEIEFRPIGPLTQTLISRSGDHNSTLVVAVQPVDSDRSVLRCVLSKYPPASQRLEVLRHHNRRMNALRERCELLAGNLPKPEKFEPAFHRVSAELAAMPEESTKGRSAPHRVRVARKWVEADEIAGLQLASIGPQLPSFQPGAHIDIHLPNGLVRQYSLINGPGETDSYKVGIKLDPDSSGGSSFLHNNVHVGDVLAISEPRNNFPLRRDAVKTILIAGGIGATPLVSMAQTLSHSRLDCEFHYFARGQGNLAFVDVLSPLRCTVQAHLSLEPEQTVSRLQDILSGYQHAFHVYVCGPGPMMEAARRTAEALGWSDEAIHFEYFKNTRAIDDSTSFEIALARSVMTLQVPAGKTILSVLRENGVGIPSSCEQGACGTCGVAVIEGEPDHQDVYLRKAEKEAGDRIMTCVSRAKSKLLVLDI